MPTEASAEAIYLRTVLDAYPSPVLIMDEHAIVVDSNRAAAGFFSAAAVATLRRPCGEILHCLHASTAYGSCGTHSTCRDCVLRKAISAAFAGAPVHRALCEMRIEESPAERPAWFRVSASLLHRDGMPLALVVLEDVTEVVLLQRLVPMCAQCRKVRDDSDYWQSVETYLTRNTLLSFTHGLCPECIRELYPDLVEESDPPDPADNAGAAAAQSS